VKKSEKCGFVTQRQSNDVFVPFKMTFTKTFFLSELTMDHDEIFKLFPALVGLIPEFLSKNSRGSGIVLKSTSITSGMAPL